MAFLALSAAERLLTPVDHIWHLFTPEELIEQAHDGALMHAPQGSGVRLIEVPFVPWAAYIRPLGELMHNPPQQTGDSTWGWIDPEDLRRCDQVWAALSRRQRDVLRSFAGGLSREATAQALHIATSTVDTHRKQILAQCHAVWNRDELIFQPHFLREKFTPYLSRQGSV